MADLGSDFAGISDIDANLSSVSGRRCLAEALATRLSTVRGGLLGDPSYGDSLLFRLNAPVSEVLLARRIEKECLKDERVADVFASVTYSAATASASIILTITDDDGPFELVLEVSQLTVELLTQVF